MVAAAGHSASPVEFDEISEHPGYGLQAHAGAIAYRLGRPEWALDDMRSFEGISGDETVVLARNGSRLADFRFEVRLRVDAAKAVAELKDAGLPIEIVSGDRETSVGLIAAELGVDYLRPYCPVEKPRTSPPLKPLAKSPHGRRRIERCARAGGRAASMAPASAADVGRNAADLVFLRESLSAVPLAISVARNASRLVRQNFAIAVAYNVVAVPFAVFGLVTPLSPRWRCRVRPLSSSPTRFASRAGGDGAARPKSTPATAVLEAAE